jgi:hypothetical protein
MQHEGATLGIMITTSFGPASGRLQITTPEAEHQVPIAAVPAAGEARAAAGSGRATMCTLPVAVSPSPARVGPVVPVRSAVLMIE